jgi:hypothetical protein
VRPIRGLGNSPVPGEFDANLAVQRTMRSLGVVAGVAFLAACSGDQQSAPDASSNDAGGDTSDVRTADAAADATGRSDGNATDDASGSESGMPEASVSDAGGDADSSTGDAGDSGAIVETVVDPGPLDGLQSVTDGTYLYYCQEHVYPNSIKRVLLTGGAPQSILQGYNTATLLLAVGGGYLFWYDEIPGNQIDAGGPFPWVFRSDVAGVNTTQFYTAQYGPVAGAIDPGATTLVTSDGARVYTVPATAPPGTQPTQRWDFTGDGAGIDEQGVAADANNIYVLNDFAFTEMAELDSMPLVSGGPTVIAQVTALPFTVRHPQVAGTNVLWDYQDQQLAYVVSTPGQGGATSTLDSRPAQIDGMVHDATNAYYADYSSGSVYRVPLGGGAPMLMGTVGNGQGTYVVGVGPTVLFLFEWLTMNQNGQLVSIPLK